jgi:hypothetical protein
MSSPITVHAVAWTLSVQAEKAKLQFFFIAKEQRR